MKDKRIYWIRRRKNKKKGSNSRYKLLNNWNNHLLRNSRVNNHLAVYNNNHNQKREDKNSKLLMKMKKTRISNSYELKYVIIPLKRKKNLFGKINNYFILHKCLCRINLEKKNLKIHLWILINLILQIPLLLNRIRISLA